MLEASSNGSVLSMSVIWSGSESAKATLVSSLRNAAMEEIEKKEKK